MIRFDSVSKYFGTKRTLSGLSFEVRRGEILGLVGRNAAGKTTTLNILSGQLLPSTGEPTAELPAPPRPYDEPIRQLRERDRMREAHR